jgi:cysteine desulfurase
MPIDLDHHLIRRPSQQLLTEMERVYAKKFRPDREEFEEWKSLLRAFKGEHFQLTCGGNEAIFRLFLDFFLQEVQETGRNHFLGDELAPLERIETLGCAVKKISLTPQALADAIKPKTSLLSFSWADPLTGLLQPVEEIVQICRQNGVKVHLNASCVIGKVPISFEDLGVDFLSFDSSIPGIGGLFQRVPVHEPISPRAALLALDVEQQLERLEQTVLETARLRDAFEAELKYTLPNCEILFQGYKRLPHISVIAFPGIMTEVLLFALERRRVHAAAYGSALSFGFSHETTEDELAEAVDAVVTSVRKLLPLSHAL